MLKIVPDPPTSTITLQNLEDLLVHASEYLTCAIAVAEQSASLALKSPGNLLSLAAVHEIQNAQSLLEAALTHVQAKH